MTPLLRQILLAVAAILGVGVMGLIGYAAYDYAETECHKDMKRVGLTRETVEVLDAVGAALGGLQRGSSTFERWPNAEFQSAVGEAAKLVKHGRRSLKAGAAFDALDALPELQKLLAKAKSLATNRVNEIMRIQDPRDATEFERLRLEGKNLLPTVKEIDRAMEILDGRTKQLPGMCSWG